MWDCSCSPSGTDLYPIPLRPEVAGSSCSPGPLKCPGGICSRPPSPQAAGQLQHTMVPLTGTQGHRDTLAQGLRDSSCVPAKGCSQAGHRPSWEGEGLSGRLLEACSLKARAEGLQPCPQTLGDSSVCPSVPPPRGSGMAAVPGVNEVTLLQTVAAPVSARGAQICSLLVRSAASLCELAKVTALWSLHCCPLHP